MKTLKRHIHQNRQIIVESAMFRNKALSDSVNYTDQIITHLAKVYLEFDKNDEQKHLFDLRNWISSAMLRKVKQKNKTMLPSTILLIDQSNDDFSNDGTYYQIAKSNLTYAKTYDAKTINKLDKNFDERVIQMIKDFDELYHQNKLSKDSIIQIIKKNFIL